MRYRCLALDHDDTVVESTPAIHYPSFIEALKVLRPERADMTLEAFIRHSFHPGILPLMLDDLHFTDAEMEVEQQIWRRYTGERTPAAYAGFAPLLLRFRARGGKVCVVSHSERGVIERHYRELFGFEPDMVFGWELPEEKRKPHPYPLQQILGALDLRPSDVLMVDDLKPGLDMAAACGVDFAYAGWSHTAREVGQQMRAEALYAFDSVSALEEFLQL